ncbi:MAG: ATP-binding protein [Planctomycetota bacterium]|nr:ATP-binding protein [Planctomycetota bacterium]
MTKKQIDLIIAAMSDRPEKQAKDSHDDASPLKGRARKAPSKSTLLGKSIIQALPIGVVAFDTNMRIIEANPHAAKLIELGDYIDQSLAKGTDDKIWQGWTQKLKSAISAGKPVSFNDVGYISDSGTKLLRIVCTAPETVTTTSNLAGIVMIEDASEKIDMRRKLAHAERLAAIGKRASKVAHELNSPLDGILRYVNLAMRVVEQENLEKPKEYLIQCRQGLLRMVRIVSELLEFSRSTYMPLEHVKIEQIIEDAVKTLESQAATLGIRILRNYALGLPQVRSGNLFQVFCNLTKNALDAMPDGGELRISTRPTAKETIVVEFRDTGTGLPTGNVKAIFEPFYTTKDKSKGTGLGLAICRDIVESCRGRITAENADDGGSVFTVYLPVDG